MPVNALWNIAFGPYRFTVDRGDRTYRLEETATGTLWADGLPLGAIEIIERESGAATRYPFGALKIASLSEKSGATGKRILFGLDAPGGIPVDVYLTCTDREIQLTVEASRDTKTHRVGEIALLPGLCRVPDDGASHLVIPHREGALVFANDTPEVAASLRVWDADAGLTMPFLGAVRFRGEAPSALALLTDSAYAVADFDFADGAGVDLRYERDPERRRLDVRVVPMPRGDAVSIARAYRDKTISDGGHVTLRKKAREKPALAAWLEGDATIPVVGSEIMLPAEGNRWQAMEEYGAQHGVYMSALSGDWAVPFVDLWEYPGAPRFGVAAPLLSVVHHDATPLCFDTRADSGETFLRALLHLAPPIPGTTPARHDAVLRPLHSISLGAFLTAHRFLTPDFAVEEALYSNGARVVINQSATDDYETGELCLPPLGFFVTHPRMEAHFARRVGEASFSGEEWRVRQSRDGKPLGESADVRKDVYALSATS